MERKVKVKSKDMKLDRAKRTTIMCKNSLLYHLNQKADRTNIPKENLILVALDQWFAEGCPTVQNTAINPRRKEDVNIEIKDKTLE